MSKAIRIVTGAAMVVAGVVTGNPGLILQGAMMVGSALITPKNKRQAVELTLGLGEQPRRAMFGEGATAGDMLDCWNYGGKYGTDWEVLVIALADHRCHSLTGVYVNDKYLPFTADGQVGGEYKDQLQIFWRPGTEDQVLPGLVTSTGPGWTAEDNLAGICYVVVAYKADKSDAKKPVWSGRPRFRWVLRGAYCYDPRKDDTVGGAGAHRWSNPDTWEWSENPTVCRYNYVRGIYACARVDQPEQLLIGRGLTDIEAPPQNLFAPANLCDEQVAIEGGSEPRYRCGGMVSADQAYIEVEEMFAVACGGIIIQPGGAVEIEPGQARPISMTITDADIVVGTDVTYNAERSLADDDWINTVVPRYVEPEQIWADHAAPIRRVYADVVADGGSREETLSLALVTWATQAGRVAEIRRRLGRLQGTGSLTLPPRFAELEEGDWVAWQSNRRFKGATKIFSIESFSIASDWRNSLMLREIAASVYADDVEHIPDGAETSQPPAPPEIGTPSAADWSLAAVLLTGSGSSGVVLQFSGVVDDDYADVAILEYAAGTTPPDPTDNSDWTLGATVVAGSTPPPITGVLAGTTYYGAVTYRVEGERGDRLMLGPVTTPALAELSGRWATESNGRWLTESGGQWILEA